MAGRVQGRENSLCKVWEAEGAGWLEELKEGGRDELSMKDGRDGERCGWRGGEPAVQQAMGVSTWGVIGIFEGSLWLLSGDWLG